MWSFGRSGDMNTVLFYGDIVTAISGGDPGGWKARHMTTTASSWVLWGTGESPDSGDPSQF